ncbi:hypothetical protein [Ammoniphilus sp. 3BR4]|uniref:hypothetical protein n=1 Tax=Ammoniphilus sp. 3BR4 TaxID=3158265 RepID=UPI003465B869
MGQNKKRNPIFKQQVHGQKNPFILHYLLKRGIIHMKTMAIFLLLFLLIASFNVFMDLLLGIPFHRALHNLRNPFWVKTGPEISFTFILILIWIAPTVYYHIAEKKK